MNDLINRHGVAAWLENMGYKKLANYIMDKNRFPSESPEQKRGKWIGMDSQCGIGCSFCGTPVDDFCNSIDYINLYYEPNFCPNCGAMMIKDGEEHD